MIEVLIATGLLTVVSLGVAQMFAMSGNANMMARNQTTTTVLAIQKMEQLRSLTWGYEPTGTGLGLALSDTTTNLAYDTPRSDGTGLLPSPDDSLTANTPGFVDFLDANGNWVGTGSAAVEGTVYIRRWSVEPLPTNPNNTLVFQVVVTTLKAELARLASTVVVARTERGLDDARIVSVKTRKAQ